MIALESLMENYAKHPEQCRFLLLTKVAINKRFVCGTIKISSCNPCTRSLNNFRPQHPPPPSSFIIILRVFFFQLNFRARQLIISLTMAAISSSRIVFFLLGFLYLALMVTCRPQSTIDSQVSSYAMALHDCHADYSIIHRTQPNRTAVLTSDDYTTPTTTTPVPAAPFHPKNDWL